MTDFGRRDFGAALKMLLEAKPAPVPPEEDPDADEVGGFTASKKAQVKGGTELDALTDNKTGIAAQLKEFAKLWKGVKKVIVEQSENAAKQLEAFAAANPGMVYSGKKTTRAAATAAAGLGADATAAATDKFDRADAAGDRETSLSPTGKVQKLSGADIRGSRKGKKVTGYTPPEAGATPGAADDLRASQVAGPGVERERVRRDRKARAAAATTGGTV